MKNQLLTSDNKVLIKDGEQFEREEIVFVKRIQPGVIVLLWCFLAVFTAVLFLKSTVAQMICFGITALIGYVMIQIEKRDLGFEHVDKREMVSFDLIAKIIAIQFFVTTLALSLSRFFVEGNEEFVLWFVFMNLTLMSTYLYSRKMI